MTNVSKHKLKQKIQQKLFNQFTNVFIVADERKLASLFDALFTDAEKIMFIKRIAIIFMLSKGVSMYAIAKSLHVSETTVRTQREKLSEGQYNAITGIIRKQKFDSDQFWEIVEVLLRGGMPSYGRNRWK